MPVAPRPTASKPQIRVKVDLSGEALPEKVFVGGMPHQIGEHDVRALVSSYGAVKDIKLIQKPTKPTSALIQFATMEEASLAIQSLNGCMAFDEKPLLVKFANPISNMPARQI